MHPLGGVQRNPSIGPRVDMHAASGAVDDERRNTRDTERFVNGGGGWRAVERDGRKHGANATTGQRKRHKDNEQASNPADVGWRAMALARRAAVGRNLTTTSFVFTREYGWWSVNTIVVGGWATGIGIVHHDVGSSTISTSMSNFYNLRRSLSGCS